MSYPLKHKIEAVINGWIAKGALSELSGYTYHKGQLRDLQTLPAIVTAVDSLEASWELQESGSTWDGIPRTAQVTVRLRTRANFSAAHTAATSETAHYDAAAALETRLGNDAGIRAYANSENITDRPVSAFYLYNVQPPRVIFDANAEDDSFVTSFVFQVVAQNTNAT